MTSLMHDVLDLRSEGSRRPTFDVDRLAVTREAQDPAACASRPRVTSSALPRHRPASRRLGGRAGTAIILGAAGLVLIPAGVLVALSVLVFGGLIRLRARTTDAVEEAEWDELWASGHPVAELSRRPRP